MASQRAADREMGAVLIAVNSYGNDPERRLPYSDRVLKGYIETFYRYLFFQVDVVVDFTLMDFNGKLKEFTTWCRNNGVNRIAVVLYGHGGIVGGKECIFTNDFKLLDIAALEEELHNQLPDDNKYLFIDACRNSVSVQPYVFQANTDRTTVIRSTLLFKTAISNAWSECFAMNLRKQGALSIIVNNVDDNMKEKYTNDIRRKYYYIPVDEGDLKSEICCKGASDDPSFQGEARASNQERIRELTPYLQGRINVAEQNLTAMRTQLNLPPKPIVTFLDDPPCNVYYLDMPAQGFDFLANLPPYNPPVASLDGPPDSPSKQPSVQGPTAPRTVSKMDEEIDKSLKVLEYKKGLISQMSMLAAVLGIDEEAADTLQGKKGANAKLKKILDLYIAEKSPTWRDFCTALKVLPSFNNVRAKIEANLYSSEDRLEEDYDYEKAVTEHGCIELDITKCTTIGPPRIGKTCLKHLLTNTPWDTNKEMPSTEAMRAPEWVECFRGEVDSFCQPWTKFSRDDRIQALYRSIASKNYGTPEPKPTNNQTRKATVPAVTDSNPDPSSLAPEEQMDTSLLNRPAVLPSEADTPKSDPTATEEYKLLVSKFSSLIPDKLQEDEKKKGQTLHKMKILHFIDTGGQSVYHDVHPILITSPSVYLVVFNLMECFQCDVSSSDLTQQALPDDFLFSDLTQQALRSIHTLTSKKPLWGDYFDYQPEQPKIFIIGTHLDNLKLTSGASLDHNKVLEKMHVNFQKKMVGMPYRNYLMYDTNGRCFWAVNNLQAGKETDEETAEYLKDLREMIVEESMTMRVKLPITWLILEHIAASCKPLFEYSNIFQMARDRRLVADKKEFDALLHVFHILGLFFVPNDADAPGSTKTYIFTDPNLLYSLTSHLLSDLKDNKNLRPTRDAIRKALPDLIHTMVEKKQLKEAIRIDPDWFISLLCQLRLMAPLGEDGTSECIIPAILPNGSVSFEGSVISLLLTYYIQHSGFAFVPSGLFCALIADILRSKSSGSVWEPQQPLYRRQVVFKVDFGEVCIQENHSNIQFDVRFESRIQEGLSAEQQLLCCNRLREELCKRLISISGSLYQQKKADFDAVAMWGIPCPCHKSEHDSSHLAVCYKIPLTDVYCATCKGPETMAPIQILSDEDIVWFADKFRRLQV